MYKKGLKEIGSFSLKKNKQRGDLIELIAVFNYLLGGKYGLGGYGRTEPNSF